ncbi:MAG TPA: alanine--glyoxylate aminotransferase family protein [bacterium]|nr:alanine--glyoxylate aminotransferase family protein [bacterium]
MSEINLLIPGPTPLPPRVLQAMGQQMTNHRGPTFGRVMAEMLAGLKDIFQTRNDIIPLVCSGTGGLEAAVVNFLAPGDRVLSVNNGHFCERFAEIAEAFGARVDRVRAEWGRPVPLDAITARVRADANREYRAVLVTQSETSTGVHNDVNAVRGVLGDHPALLMVDAVSSLGAIPLETDAWNIDVVVTGSQKALMSPPGMAFVSVSDRAWAAADRVSTPRFYLDLRRGRTEVHRALPSTAFTTAVTVAYAVHEALRLIHEEGLEHVFERHRRIARMVRAGVRGMGLHTLADDAWAVDTVTPVRMPEGVDAVAVGTRAREEYDVLLGRGIGPLEHTVVRIGHLGYTLPEMLLSGLDVLGRTLNDLGHPVPTGAGLAAARRTLETAARR